MVKIITVRENITEIAFDEFSPEEKDHQIQLFGTCCGVQLNRLI